MDQRHAAFSLVESLIAIAILSILVAVLSATWGSSLRQAREVKCLNNLRQLGLASLEYAAENNGQLPQSSHQGPSRAWTKVLKTYLPASVFVSPLDDTGRANSYAVNDFITEFPFGAAELNFSRVQSIPAPAETLYMAVVNAYAQNTDHFHFTELGHPPTAAHFSAEAWVDLIENSSHYLFVDGHAERIEWRRIQETLGQTGSRFVRPDGFNSN